MDLGKDITEEGSHETLKIDIDYFEKIYHLRFYSFDDSEA